MVTVLLAHPIALAAFLTALGVILAGGSVLMFAVKAGSVTVLLAGDRAAGAIEQPPLRLAALRQAQQASLECFSGGVRRLFPRYLRLGIALTGVYGLIAVAYLAFLLLYVERLPLRLGGSVAVGATLAIYAVFDLWLRVPLPRGPWGF